jgi:hypothetical protein
VGLSNLGINHVSRVLVVVPCDYLRYYLFFVFFLYPHLSHRLWVLDLRFGEGISKREFINFINIIFGSGVKLRSKITTRKSLIS